EPAPEIRRRRLGGSRSLTPGGERWRAPLGISGNALTSKRSSWRQVTWRRSPPFSWTSSNRRTSARIAVVARLDAEGAAGMILAVRRDQDVTFELVNAWRRMQRLQEQLDE